MRRFFGLKRVGVGSGRLQVELDVGSVDAAAADIDKFDDVQAVTGVDGI